MSVAHTSGLFNRIGLRWTLRACGNISFYVSYLLFYVSHVAAASVFVIHILFSYRHFLSACQLLVRHRSSRLQKHTFAATRVLIITMDFHGDQPNRPYPRRTSSRFAPGVYFNFEWGVALNANDRPTHIRGVNYTSRRMQERFTREEAQRQQRSQQGIRRKPVQLPQLPHPTIETPNLDIDVNWEYRDFQQERQRRHGVSTREQHSRGSSAPPSFEREDIISPVSPLSPENSIRPQRHAVTFPRETLDRPLPYSPARFRLGEDELPWSTPLWYRPADSENSSPVLTRTSPALQHVRRHSASQASISQASITSKSSSQSQSRLSLMGGLPSLGYDSVPGRPSMQSPQQRRSPRRHVTSPITPTVQRQEDPQRVRDLGELHSAMIGVDGLDLYSENDGWESWAPNNRGRTETTNTSTNVTTRQSPFTTFRESRSLGWAVRAEADLSTASGGEAFHQPNSIHNDAAGYYGRDMAQQSSGYGAQSHGNNSNWQQASAYERQSQLMSPPPAYLESQWEMLGRRIARPRSSDDRMGSMVWGITYWG